jgi:hypothetical protein
MIDKEMFAEEALRVSMAMNNVDPRRKQELADANMIHEDHTDVANLSRRFIHRTFDANEYPERLAMYNQSQRRRSRGV